MSDKKIYCAFFFHDTDYYSGGTRSLLDIIDSYIEKNSIKLCAVFPSKSGSAVDYMKEKKVDIVCSHYYQIRYDLNETKLNFIKRLPFRLFRLICSKVWIVMFTTRQLKKRGINIIYNNTSFILAGYWAAKKMDVPVIAHFREFGEEDHKIGRWIGNDIFYKISNRYDRIICISKSLERKYASYINPNRLRVIYDDVSAKYINWNNEHKIIEKEEFNVLLAGNLTPGMGQLNVLKILSDILKNNKAINIYIAGNLSDSSYVSQIKETICIKNLQDQVKILGLVQDMNSLRAKMHVGIVFSDMEAFGRVTIEGMLSGMVMIGSDAGGSSELIDNNKTGFLVKADGSNLAATFLYVYNHYSSLYPVQQAAFIFAKKFTEGHCANLLSQNLCEVMRT